MDLLFIVRVNSHKRQQKTTTAAKEVLVVSLPFPKSPFVWKFEFPFDFFPILVIVVTAIASDIFCSFKLVQFARTLFSNQHFQIRFLNKRIKTTKLSNQVNGRSKLWLLLWLYKMDWTRKFIRSTIIRCISHVEWCTKKTARNQLIDLTMMRNCVNTISIWVCFLLIRSIFHIKQADNKSILLLDLWLLISIWIIQYHKKCMTEQRKNYCVDKYSMSCILFAVLIMDWVVKRHEDYLRKKNVFHLVIFVLTFNT